MLINCDLGESYGTRRIGSDAEVMPHIDQANIACGYHGGDPVTMRDTLALARRHDVAIGAHPSYPDLEGFGRRSMVLSMEEIVAAIHYQMAALEGMATAQGLTVGHVKPHGALYNDMMARPEVRAAIFEALATWHRPLLLLLQATPAAEQHREEARAAGIEVQFEAFADRRYTAEGLLMPRSKTGAVLNTEQTREQVQRLHEEGVIITSAGTALPLQADTLCVHGDTPGAAQAVRMLRELLADARTP